MNNVVTKNDLNTIDQESAAALVEERKKEAAAATAIHIKSQKFFVFDFNKNVNCSLS